MSVDKEEIRKALNQEIPVEWHKSAPTWLRVLLAENEQWADGCDELNKQIETLKKRMNRLAETSVDKSEHQETQHQLTEALKLWGECEEQNRQLWEENERLHAAVKEYEERRQSALTESQRILSENERLREQVELQSTHPLTRAFKNLEKHQRQINASE